MSLHRSGRADIVAGATRCAGAWRAQPCVPRLRRPERAGGGGGRAAEGLAVAWRVAADRAGALGVFPIYHAFTQEISADHQGKVTGVASIAAWVFSSPAQKLFDGSSTEPVPSIWAWRLPGACRCGVCVLLVVLGHARR